MKFILRFLGFLFAAGTIVFVVGVAAVAAPAVALFQGPAGLFPAAGLRAAGDDAGACGRRFVGGRICARASALHSDPGGAEAGDHAFLAAEDKNFYEHGGLDFTGIARAAFTYLQNYGSGRRPQGASTITQQVAKNFLLTNEVSLTRKIKEALLALKIERTYSKDKILELYLNEIYLGLGAYGIAAASLVYFDKAVNELTIPEAAYLATLPKAPNNYNPFRQPRARA